MILKPRIILTALLNWMALTSAAFADVATLVPTSVSGGIGTVSTLQAEDGISQSAPLFAPPTWSDEFDGSGPPNPAVWTFEQGFVRNQELQWYQSNNAWQENGKLIIEGRREQKLNPNYVAGSTDWRTNRQYAQYTSSSIKSQGKYSFQYGRMQVRAKIPCFPGTWPAIWTLGNGGEWPSCGECDVLEYYSPDSVLANLARGSNSRWSAAWDAVKKPVSPLFTATNPNPNWRTEHHIWTMQWDQDNIRLYIDNHLMNTTAQSWLVNPVTTWGPKNPFKQPHFLLLNLALGGAGGNPANTAFPLRYELDYVRVWEGLTENNPPTDLTLSDSTVPQGLPGGTVVGNLTATDVDAAEVHGFSLVAGTGDTHNSSFEIVFNSDQTKTSVLRTKAVLDSASGATRSIRVRVSDIEGATYDKILTVQLVDQFVIEVKPATLSVPEGGTESFDVRLRVPPTQTIPVNISRISGDADLTVASSSQLVFTPANGTAWQTVTLSAAGDTDRINGTATFVCNDPSGVFLNATVVANESDSEPILEATVQLVNLDQTYDGSLKSVTVITTPANRSHDVTYGGQFMPPADAGSYEVVATINDPDYMGSASGTLVIAKAAQTINFAPIDPVLDNADTFELTATASTGFPVLYTSSNTNVATLSGNMLTITGPGSTTITASQAGNDNYDAATPVPQILTVLRVDPLAVTTGPYVVLFNQSLSLNGAGSQPSNGQTLTNYFWDLNNDGTFGDVTGATPAALTYANLTTVWGLTDGFNTITLRVIDSSGRISTASTTVEVVANLTWDANGAAALRSDGAGDWTTPDQWWNGTTNATWVSGDDAIFGNGGAGGEVTLTSPTMVNTIAFNSFTGTYTLGTTGQTITLKNGITKNAAAGGGATIISPISLSADQSWTNDSTGLLAIGPAALSNGGFLLSVGGTGNIAVSGTIGGAGGLTKTGAGTLNLSSSSAYAGPTTVSNGTLILSNANTINAATSVAATGTLQLGHATSMGTSTMALASGATLQLRNDTNTTFTAPIATATNTGVTYNFDVNNAGGAATGKTLTLGNLTFAASFAGSVTNRINVTGGNGYTLRLGTLTAPSGGGSAHPLVINPTSAAVAISRVTSGSNGTALNFIGSNSATLGDFELGSNGWQSISVNGPTVTLGTTSPAGNRNSNGAAAIFTLTSGTLNLTTSSSIANLTWYASGDIVAPTFNINGGTLNNTSGSALNLGTSTSGYFNNNPAITLGGNFAFGSTAATSANNLNLGTGTVTNAGNRTITLTGTGTTLTLGGTMTNSVAGNQTTTVNGAGNTLTLGAYNLSNSTSARTGIFNGSGNVMITSGVTGSSNGTPASNLTYSGTGTLTLSGQNTFSGTTNVNSGTLAIPSTGKLYSTSTSAVTRVNPGATLQLYAWQYGINGSIGNPYFGTSTLIVNGGTITYTGVGENSGSNNGRTFAIGTNGATLDAAGSGTWFLTRNANAPLDQSTIYGLTLTGSGNGRYSNVLAGASGTLTKSGSGTWTLTGANTYTGVTAIDAGTLALVGGSQASAIIVAGGASLGFTLGSPTTSTAAVNLTAGTVRITGAVDNVSGYKLMTATSFTGPFALAPLISNYELETQNGDTELWLVPTGGSDPYTTWSGGEAFDADANNDGVKNGLAWLLGAANPTTNATGKLPEASRNGGNLRLTFRCLKSTNRGAAQVKVQSSNDLGASDPWTSHEAVVPDADSTVNGVIFDTSDDGDFINVIADIPAAGIKLFGRLQGTP